MSIDTSKVATTNATTAATAKKPSKLGAAATWADDRLGLATAGKKQLRKVFPDHWSFMLGEIALWSFVVLLLTGTFLTLWFDPSMTRGRPTTAATTSCAASTCPQAYASTLNISFDVRGGLLMRQMHHWSAMLFIAAMMVHLMRVFFTGAFRKPRELNWVIGCLLLLLGTLEGFTGYSLPDDLLSGTGIRAADGFMKSMPVVGTYMSFFLFGGEFPGEAIIPTAVRRPHPVDPRDPAGADRCPHAAARLPQAHPVARSRPHRAERRRLPADARLHGQGRRLLLHRLRRDRLHGRAALDQPGVEVRTLRPVQGHRGLPARLVHGLAGRCAADHARLGEPPVLGSGRTARRDPVVERVPAHHRAARPGVHGAAAAAVPRGLGDRRQA